MIVSYKRRYVKAGQAEATYCGQEIYFERGGWGKGGVVKLSLRVTRRFLQLLADGVPIVLYDSNSFFKFVQALCVI